MPKTSTAAVNTPTNAPTDSSSTAASGCSTGPAAPRATGTAHPIRQRVESQWPKSLLALVAIVAVLGVVALGTDPRDSAADGLDLVVGTTAAVAGEDLRVLAEFERGEHRVQFLDGPDVPCLIAVLTADGRALGVYERYDLAVRSYPEIDSPALAREFAVLSRTRSPR